MSACRRSIAWTVGLMLSLFTVAANAEFESKAGWNYQLFPSFLVATATVRLPAEALEEYENQQVLGDPQGVLGITLEAPEDETSVTVTISCDAIMEPSSFTTTLATAGETYTILPKIKWNYETLARQHQPRPVSVTFEVTIDEETEEKTETLTLRSINDCPFTVVDGDDSTDLCFMFAAYVNEQHPFVDKVLREGLDTGVIESFTGYQSQDKAEVYRQVYALWHALSLRDLRYSDITTSAADSDCVYSQHVRLIDESIGNAQANCADGSVLLASLLRKIGIEPQLVMVTGHCYLLFALDPEGTEIAALETTLLGSKLEGDAAEIDGLDADAIGKWSQENSWKSFAAALAIGNEDLVKNAEQFKAGTDPDYQLINIAAARRIGILPIAFQAEESFIASPRTLIPADEQDEEDSDE